MSFKPITTCICANLLLCLTLAYPAWAQSGRMASEASINNIAVAKPIAPALIKRSNVFTTHKKWLSHSGTATATLSNIQLQLLVNAKLDTAVQLPTQVTAKVHQGWEQKKPFAFIVVPQYVMQNGQVFRVANYDINITQQPAPPAVRGSRVYASNSVLASGNFYKISIAQQGMYKIDYAFVKDKLGIEPNTITTTNIRLYGNGGTMVPENNIIPRPDDLVENNIQLVGMDDGNWGPNDYVLFYANGPTQLIPDSINKRFGHQVNLYSTLCYYLLNFDKGAGARVTTAPALVPNITINTYNAYSFVEQELYNAGNFGQQWWGYKFGTASELSQLYNFDITNIVPSTLAHVAVGTGVQSLSGSSTFNITANNTAFTTLYHGETGPNFYEPAVDIKEFSSNVTATGSNLAMQFSFTPGNDFAVGYLNFIKVNCLKNLVFNGSFLQFASWQSVGANNIAGYNITSPSNASVWDVTNPLSPIALPTTYNNGVLSVAQEAKTLKQFVAFTGSNFAIPTYEGTVANQNLHGLAPADFIIVSHPNFIAEANRLAQHHTAKNGLRCLVLTPQQIYNEFSSCAQDISAIRDCIKMFYDKATTPADMPKSVLLFGDASYDYQNRIASNTNLVPTRETPESSDRIDGYCSDDFYGMLDDNEFIQSALIPNTMDIGVGRIPCNTLSQANIAVNKIINYQSPASYGAWKNNFTFCADNRDYSIHAKDAEIMSSITNDSFKTGNIYKVYIDAFTTFATPGGDRAPQAKQVLDAQLFNGTALVNYNGHGSPSAWCEERLFVKEDIATYNNLNKLPLFITATCDFAPFDQPNIYSAGEALLLAPNGGAIALMTTTQLVFQNENRIMNSDYMSVMFKPDNNNQVPNFGEAFRASKNLTYFQAGDERQMGNFRKFTLLGDPALHIGIPQNKVSADSLNGVAFTNSNVDTLKALNIYRLSGFVRQANNTILTSFNGVVDVTIYDKQKTLRTLQNNDLSPAINYNLQNNIVFKGKASVVNGYYTITFIVPKDIDYNIGFGKVSLYAFSPTTDAAGYNNTIKIGGVGDNTITDNTPPTVQPFINSDLFIDGGITGTNSTLLVKLDDDNGLNTTGTSIGHDIVAILDDNANEPLILNNYYQGLKDSFKKGIINYPLKNLSPGRHTLSVKAWDVSNNSGSGTISFVVEESNKAALDKVFNYPNPFTSNTSFRFEHNQYTEPIYVTIEVYTMSGAMVRSIRQLVNGAVDIPWDGTDQYGQKLAKGVYLYKVHYKTTSGKTNSKYQKLVIL
jgi:hypothetical protein